MLDFTKTKNSYFYGFSCIFQTWNGKALNCVSMSEKQHPYLPVFYELLHGFFEVA